MFTLSVGRLVESVIFSLKIITKRNALRVTTKVKTNKRKNEFITLIIDPTTNDAYFGILSLKHDRYAPLPQGIRDFYENY